MIDHCEEAAIFLDSLADDKHPMVYSELESMYKSLALLHVMGYIEYKHTAARKGYESRKTCGHLEHYRGKYGTGYIHVKPRWDKQKMVYVTYYIWKE